MTPRTSEGRRPRISSDRSRTDRRLEGGARAQASVLLLRLAQICPKGNLLQPWFELAEALKNAAQPAGSMIYGAVGVPADR